VQTSAILYFFLHMLSAIAETTVSGITMVSQQMTALLSTFLVYIFHCRRNICMSVKREFKFYRSSQICALIMEIACVSEVS